MRPPNLFPAPSRFPVTTGEVLSVAKDWFRPHLVGLDRDRIQSIPEPNWVTGVDPAMFDPRTPAGCEGQLELSIAMNAINFRFWDVSESGSFLRYSRDGVVGAAAMMDAFKSAWQPGRPLDMARQGLRPVDAGLIQDVFGAIPDPKARVRILNEIFLPGRLPSLAADLAADWATSGATVAGAARLAQTFPAAYADPVLKKAQLALSEVHIQQTTLGRPSSCDLTAFADYQIPNVLRALGVLTYDDDLARRIEAGQLLTYGGVEESAIRAASLLAVQALSDRFRVPSAAIDHFLWSQRKTPTTPFHLCLTTAY